MFFFFHFVQEDGSPIPNKEPEPIIRIQENVEEQIFARTKYVMNNEISILISYHIIVLVNALEIYMVKVFQTCKQKKYF